MFPLHVPVSCPRFMSPFHVPLHAPAYVPLCVARLRTMAVAVSLLHVPPLSLLQVPASCPATCPCFMSPHMSPCALQDYSQWPLPYPLFMSLFHGPVSCSASSSSFMPRICPLVCCKITHHGCCHIPALCLSFIAPLHALLYVPASCPCVARLCNIAVAISPLYDPASCPVSCGCFISLLNAPPSRCPRFMSPLHVPRYVPASCPRIMSMCCKIMQHSRCHIPVSCPCFRSPFHVPTSCPRIRYPCVLQDYAPCP